MKTIVLAAWCVLALSAGHAEPSQTPREEAVAAFNQGVADYVALHRRLEGAVPPQQSFTNPDEALKASTALAKAIRAARPHAREGDIFVAAAAQEFRTLIQTVLRERDVDPDDLVTRMREEAVRGGRPPRVNERFSWAVGNVMPPCLLRELPSLPDELQYRLVGLDLILIDIHADLVVDILRHALPAMTKR
jgi:hypothetical protein